MVGRDGKSARVIRDLGSEKREKGFGSRVSE